MSLSALGQLVAKLTQPNPDGQNARKEFNKKPHEQGGSLSGPEWVALLSFKKGTIAQCVLDAYMQDKDELGPIDDLRDHMDWLYDFARWNWPDGESHEYDGDKPPVEMDPLYGGASCQIYMVSGNKAPSPTNTNTYDVTLDVWVEGALDKAEVRVLEGDTVVHSNQQPMRSGGSTFRFARLTTQCTLPANSDGTPRTYRTIVVNHLPGNEQVVIGVPGEGEFTVP